MVIKTAEFIVSNTDYKNCPKVDKLEYAFIGRSNVGKSSLINALANKKSLAKTSGKPGKTQLINHFLINKEWYLVDLPGYGFAKTSKARRAIFHEMISNYLRNRSNLNCLFVLIDSRHKPQSIDQDFLQWLAECQIPFVMVFTKSDKLGKRALENNIETYKSEMIKNWEYLPKIFVSSAEKKKGLQEILDYIMSLNSNFSAK
ncbi:MAG: YihA family ribosome biogenesis GTP-binding protein [Flavobacteriales bacterium]|jgi:GTP-binding protein|nr:YihA family ribosome biogenesis GTP-binding protein [Flavobacteriales bacterium]MDC1069197.1 ribosome biogenesis GTP-binding protein YihA/YsxC [Flavobacteriales bacterium]MDC3390191.1 ribosome biogenesis GTP-binding protein YihA/YsxC [Flavobacteriales bacterium]MDG1284010.1 ribosome biogenesis GTP-binding protein YihA/YsxC [Flavobacteriales bacterium]|tara:strand:+ start:1440 stop:2045 length:606 start_codon:yes stop_codon:yes gene_type:complete